MLIVINIVFWLIINNSFKSEKVIANKLQENLNK